MHPETLAIHAGHDHDPHTRAVAVPIYQTVAYAFDDARHGAALFNLAEAGNIYTRIMNPTCAVLEQRVAALEGGTGALAVSAGSAAIFYAAANIARAGQNIVSVPQLYGGTYTLFAHMLPRFGIEVRFAADDRAESLAALADKNTRAFFCESVGNPAGNVADLAALAEAAHSAGVPLIVDNTVPSPAITRPMEHGADIVIHSLTKYMGGHGNSLGGMLTESGNFPWEKDAARWPEFTAPEPSYHGAVFAEARREQRDPFCIRARVVALRNTGAALSPFNAFMILQGLETLHMRMERCCENALRVAEHLREHPRAEWVNYAGLAEHRHHDLARKYAEGRPGSILTFGARGGYEAGVKFHDALKLFKRLVNIGDVRSLACHPASTTHRQLSEEEMRAAGVSPETIRLCVGTENIADILEDLDQALDAAG